ncbi:MAG: hypothetical protein Q8N88_04735 [Nanoarchaeota archaeon]|nr:hypothetical protein [Nanoarchaeota archaeon]
MGIQLIRCISGKKSVCNLPASDDPAIGKCHTTLAVEDSVISIL